MKKHIGLVMAIMMVLTLVACGGGGGASQTDDIQVKGVFILDPASELDLSDDNLASAQQYLFVVYDVTNSSSQNQSLSTHDSSIKITFNKENTYEQHGYQPETLRNFIEDCGYPVSTDYGTLWGGSEAVRMVASFAINKNDAKAGSTAEINFALSADLQKNVKIAAEDIETINLLDGIFAVEDYESDYQIYRSVKTRLEICRRSLENASAAEKNRDRENRDLGLALCDAIFAEEATWGVACGLSVLSEDLPKFNIAAVRRYDADLANDIITISDSIETMILELEKSSPNYDRINEAQRLAYNTMNACIEDYEN